MENLKYKLIKITSYEESERLYINHISPKSFHNKICYNTKTHYGMYNAYVLYQEDYKYNSYKEDTSIDGKDKFSLSRIYLLTDMHGNLIDYDTRWFNKYRYNYNISENDIKKIVNDNFPEIFNISKDWKNLLDKIESQLKTDIPLEDIFESVLPCEYTPGYYLVWINGFCNFVTDNRELLCKDCWFDQTRNFYHNYAIVVKDEKWFIYDKFGNKIYDDEFQYAYYYTDGLMIVKMGDWYMYNPETGMRIICDYNESVDYNALYFPLITQEISSDLMYFQSKYAIVSIDDEYYIYNNFAQIHSYKFYNFPDFKDFYPNIVNFIYVYQDISAYLTTKFSRLIVSTKSIDEKFRSIRLVGHPDNLFLLCRLNKQKQSKIFSLHKHQFLTDDIYDDVEFTARGYFRVKKDNEEKILLHNGEYRDLSYEEKLKKY